MKKGNKLSIKDIMFLLIGAVFVIMTVSSLKKNIFNAILLSVVTVVLLYKPIKKLAKFPEEIEKKKIFLVILSFVTIMSSLVIYNIDINSQNKTNDSEINSITEDGTSKDKNNEEKTEEDVAENNETTITGDEKGNSANRDDNLSSKSESSDSVSIPNKSESNIDTNVTDDSNSFEINDTTDSSTVNDENKEYTSQPDENSISSFSDSAGGENVVLR